MKFWITLVLVAISAGAAIANMDLWEESINLHHDLEGGGRVSVQSHVKVPIRCPDTGCPSRSPSPYPQSHTLIPHPPRHVPAPNNPPYIRKAILKEMSVEDNAVKNNERLVEHKAVDFYNNRNDIKEQGLPVP
uniref:Uncharacterized protein n=1 Tax=Glossina austeni TaxID=7395 RepID=A0A1A9UI77_GLOAU